MIDKNEVKKLAKLSRITLKDKEVESLTNDFVQIVDYVSQLNKVHIKPEEEYFGENKNLMRDDGPPHASGVYTDELIQVAPETEKGFVKVNKVIDTGE